MKQIITRYLTKKPKLPQNQSLKTIANCLGEYPEEDVTFALEIRYKDNKEWLKNK
jgi:hypothetical protein